MASNQSTGSQLIEPISRTTRKSASELIEIVAFIDNRKTAESIMEFAGLLADENGARLIGVFVRPFPVLTSAETFVCGTGIRELSERLDAQVESIEGRQRTAFQDIVRRHGIARSEWRSLSPWSSEVAVHAHYADLVLIGRPEPGQMSGPPALTEPLVLSSGRPIILFPPSGTASRVRRILVGWNATREAIRAVADALPLLARAEVVQVLIVDDQRGRERQGREPGSEIADHLALHGAQVEVQRVSSGGENVGHVLLSHAAAFGADLLVMGAYGHSKLHEWIFGGVTRTVLYEADLPVLMSR